MMKPRGIFPLLVALVAGASVGLCADPVTLEQHPSVIASVAYLDEENIASGCGDALVRIWSLKSRELVARLEGHASSVTALAKLGSQIAVSGDKNGQVIFWDIKSGLKKTAKVGDREITKLVASPDGKLVAASSMDGTVSLLDSKTGDRVRSLLHGRVDGVSALTFSPHGKSLISGDLGGRIKLWETATGRAAETWELGDGLVFGLSFEGPEGFSAVLRFEKEAKLFRWAIGGTEKTTKSLGDCVSTARGVGLMAVAHRNGLIQLLDDKGTVALEVGQKDNDPILALDFAPDGKRIVTGSLKGCLRTWDTGLLRKAAP